MKSTREKILETAQLLFVRNSYRAVSMNMIASDLGISKPALYHYFKSKEELFLEIFSNAAQSFKEKVRESIQKDMNSREKVRNFIIAYTEFFVKHNSVLFLMVQKLSEKDKTMIKHMETFRREMLEFLEPLVKDLKKTSKKEARIFTIMMLGMISALAKETFCPDELLKITPSEAADHIMGLLFK